MSKNPASMPEVRFFVALPRSGSTLLMRIFGEYSDAAVTSRLILQGNKDTGSTFHPNYSILENPQSHRVFIDAVKSGKKLIISKEELGNDRTKGECSYDILPNPEHYDMVRPVFLIRDPIRVFDSWKKVGWKSVASLIDCYDNLFRMLEQAPSQSVSCLVYERLIREPEKEIRKICARWGIPFSPSMLNFEKPFGSSFVYSTEHKKRIYTQEKPLGLFTNVENNSSITDDVPSHGLLTNDDKALLESRLGQRYLSVWGESVTWLRDILMEKEWFVFDFDNTMHEYEAASQKAAIAVLRAMSKHHGIRFPDLSNEYEKILHEQNVRGYSEPKTSYDYRKERFLSLLSRLCHKPSSHAPHGKRNHAYMTEYLDLYERTYINALELKCGALSLLTFLQRLGKKVIVITDGTQDELMRTTTALKLDGGKIDIYATTSQIGATKTKEGLFSELLTTMANEGIAKATTGDIVYVSGNKNQDIACATAEGVFSVHLDEKYHISLDDVVPKINTLTKLEHILSYDA
jgi:putative hydrolase of the HAD superfamily